MTETSKPENRGRAGRRDFPVLLLIWLVAVVALVPAVLLAIYGLDRWTKAEQERELDRVASLARGLGQAIDRQIDALTDTVEVLAGSRHLSTGDIRTFDEIARDAAVNAKGHFVLIDRSMQQLVNTRTQLGTPLPRTANATDIQRVFDSGKGIVTDLSPAAVAEKVVFAIIVPVTIEGTVRFALAFVPEISAIVRIANEMYKPEGWLAAVLDGTGKMLARSHLHEQFFGRQANYFSRFAGRSGTVESVDLEGRASVTAYHRLTQSNWLVAVWAPKSLLVAPRQNMQKMLTVLFLATLALSMVGAWIASKLIQSPSRQLVAGAAALGQGKIVDIPAGIMREANIIAEAMMTASRQIVDRTAALQSSEQRLRLAIDAADAGFWTWNLTTGQRTLDTRSLQIAGWGGEQVIDAATILAHIHPDDRELVRAATRRAFLPEGDGVYRVEYRIVTPGGAERWISSQAHTRTNGQPSAQMVGIVRDITKRKQAEQHIGLLMQELVHRSKNMLAVVQVIATQTAKTADPATFGARLSERLTGLAASQELLVKNEWKGIELAALVHAQLAPYRDFIGTRVLVDGPVVSLQPAAAQAIGMALHELATNACKYGALSTPLGTVRITWAVEGPARERSFVMQWVEEGGPKVAAPTRKGFGEVVIVRMVTGALGGQTDLEFAETGLRWRVRASAQRTIDASNA